LEATSSSRSSRLWKWIRWLVLGLGGLVVLAGLWFAFTRDPEITALRNVVHYQVVTFLGGPKLRLDQQPGGVSGIVEDVEGNPISGATVLVASPLGHAYTAASDANGRYRLENVPPGRYVPVAGKRDYQDGLNRTCFAGMCFKHTLRVRPGREVQGADLALTRTEPPDIVVDDSLMVSPTVKVAVGAPFPSESLRTHFSFERAGMRVNDCYLYEPSAGDGPFPTLLLVLPGPVLGWEIVPVPFAAEGYSVLAFYPLRGIDIDADAADVLTALEYLRQGRIPSRADTEQLVLVGASYSSLHAYRLLGLTDEVDVALVLGGMVDGFAFRHDVEMGVAETRPPFDQILMALGFPHTSPEQYFKYSVRYHLEGLPPLCLLHGMDDELSPFSQSVQLAEELERRGHPHEFYAYEGLKHYFSTSADNATTQQMWQDSLDCLGRALGNK
jgi:hypothetical protein